MVTLRQFGMFFAVLLSGCASTTVTLTPSPQLAVSDPAASALVLWSPQWRPDQKDVSNREAAAQAGLQTFLDQSDCFSRSELRRIPDLSSTAVSGHVKSATSQFSRVVVIAVRELGPVVKLLSTAALVDGGTEVVLHVTAYSAPELTQPREFAVHWQNGGHGVIKGVESLPGDMQAALLARLRPSASATR